MVYYTALNISGAESEALTRDFRKQMMEWESRYGKNFDGRELALHLMQSPPSEAIEVIPELLYITENDAHEMIAIWLGLNALLRRSTNPSDPPVYYFDEKVSRKLEEILSK